MNQDQTIAVYGVVGVVVFAFLYRRREAVTYALKRGLIAFAICCVAFVVLWKLGVAQPVAYFTALVIGVLIRLAEPKRPRYIRTRKAPSHREI